MLTIVERPLHNPIMERTIQKLVPVEGSSVSIDVYGEPDAPALVVIPGAMADAAEWGGWRATSAAGRPSWSSTGGAASPRVR
nr:hypothetical protein GCM10025730_48720 [Promicromonospora thailandica]